jgi:hypothetical protein
VDESGDVQPLDSVKITSIHLQDTFVIQRTALIKWLKANTITPPETNHKESVEHPEKMTGSFEMGSSDYPVQNILVPLLLKLGYDYTKRENRFKMYADLMQKFFGIQQKDGTIIPFPDLFQKDENGEYRKDENGKLLDNPEIQTLQVGQIIRYDEKGLDIYCLKTLKYPKLKINVIDKDFTPEQQNMYVWIQGKDGKYVRIEHPYYLKGADITLCAMTTRLAASNFFTKIPSGDAHILINREK